jgi:transmembrane sensor
MKEDIYLSILNGSASETEKIKFYQELENDKELLEGYLHFKTLYTGSILSGSKHFTTSGRNFENLWSRMNPGAKSVFVNNWLHYAAIFIVALSLGFAANFMIHQETRFTTITSNIEYSSEKGAVSRIHLEDGSTIWLSSGSKIDLRRESTGKITATLNGEAYFDMVPDNKRDLTVDLGYFKVKDIGTKFDIRAYHDEKLISATLVNGQIDVSGSSAQPLLSLKPGEYLQFDKQTNHMNVTKQDPSISSAWKDGKFVFIHKSLAEICRELEAWYNVRIEINNHTLANTRYTSVIKRTTTVKLVLEMLSLTDKIHYKITDRKEGKDLVYIF